LATAFAVATFGLLAASPAYAGWPTGNPTFGPYTDLSSPVTGYLYTPAKLAAKPAIIVALHPCQGSWTSAKGWFDSAAETNGFYIIAPSANSGNCFDSSASRAGDRAAIVRMVNSVITQMNADPARVFAAGFSSGGCMTNTLLGIYPDVFAGGSAMPGYPAGAWPAGDISCSLCGHDPTGNTDYAAAARKVFTWSGTYPCSQQWVGGGDEYKFNDWLPAVAAEFQSLGNLGSGTSATSAISGWTRTVYKDAAGNVRLQTNLGPSTQKHNLIPLGAPLFNDVVSFLGLDKPTGACGIATTAGSGGATGTSTGGQTGTSSGGATGTSVGGQTGTSSGGATGTSVGGTTGTGAGGRGAGGTTGGGTGGAVSSSGGATGTGSGGHVAGSGGSAVTGEGGSEVTGAGGSTAGTGGDNNNPQGCSCAAAGTGARGGAAIAFLALALTIARRRRSRR
jgi:endo-1,4-beta-xylanase